MSVKPVAVKKPIYSMSATLFNKLKWYKGRTKRDAKEAAFQQIIDAVNKVPFTNIYVERGLNFEDEVYLGKHPGFKVELENSEKQQWSNAYIEYSDFIIKLTGKTDIYDADLKTIYDIKRTKSYWESNFSDENTIQHDLYLYMIPEATKFTYLIASGEPEQPITYITLDKPRKDNLEQYIINHIEELLQFFHQHNLLETYFEKFRAKF